MTNGRVNTTQGWAVPPMHRQAHYFVQGKSLCGDADYFGTLEDFNHDHPDNCFTCMRIRQEREVAGGAK